MKPMALNNASAVAVLAKKMTRWDMAASWRVRRFRASAATERPVTLSNNMSPTLPIARVVGLVLVAYEPKRLPWGVAAVGSTRSGRGCGGFDERDGAS